MDDISGATAETVVSDPAPVVAAETDSAVGDGTGTATMTDDGGGAPTFEEDAPAEAAIPATAAAADVPTNDLLGVFGGAAPAAPVAPAAAAEAAAPM